MSRFVDIQEPQPEMNAQTREILGLEFPTVTIGGSNCSTGPHEDGSFYERRYQYGIQISFNDSAAKKAFLARPSLQEDATTIAKTVEGALQGTFDLEGERDFNGFYADESADEADMIASITSGTQADIDVTLEQDIEPVIMGTFPDAGIRDITITDISGRDALCYPATYPYENFGQIRQEAPRRDEPRVAQGPITTPSLGL